MEKKHKKDGAKRRHAIESKELQLKIEGEKSKSKAAVSKEDKVRIDTVMEEMKTGKMEERKGLRRSVLRRGKL